MIALLQIRVEMLRKTRELEQLIKDKDAHILNLIDEINHLTTQTIRMADSRVSEILGGIPDVDKNNSFRSKV